MFVDMCNLEVIQVETHTQIIGTQHAMQVGNCCKLFGNQSAIECIESCNTFILSFYVGFHETDVWS